MYALLKPCAQDGSDPDVLVTGVRQMYSHSDCFLSGASKDGKNNPKQAEPVHQKPSQASDTKAIHKKPKQASVEQPAHKKPKHGCT